MQETSFPPKVYRMLTFVYNSDDDSDNDIYIVIGLAQLSL